MNPTITSVENAVEERATEAGSGLREAVLELRLAEQAILSESLQEKNGRIRELESQVRFLKELLAQMPPALQPQTARKPAPVPRRWKVLPKT